MLNNLGQRFRVEAPATDPADPDAFGGGPGVLPAADMVAQLQRPEILVSPVLSYNKFDYPIPLRGIGKDFGVMIGRGRAETGKITIDDQAVSRDACRLYVDDAGKFFIQGVSNTTRVELGAQRINENDEVAINHGDQLTLFGTSGARYEIEIKLPRSGGQGTAVESVDSLADRTVAPTVLMVGPEPVNDQFIATERANFRILLGKKGPDGGQISVGEALKQAVLNVGRKNSHGSLVLREVIDSIIIWSKDPGGTLFPSVIHTEGQPPEALSSTLRKLVAKEGAVVIGDVQTDHADAASMAAQTSGGIIAVSLSDKKALHNGGVLVVTSKNPGEFGADAFKILKALGQDATGQYAARQLTMLGDQLRVLGPLAKVLDREVPAHNGLQAASVNAPAQVYSGDVKMGVIVDSDTAAYVISDGVDHGLAPFLQSVIVAQAISLGASANLVPAQKLLDLANTQLIEFLIDPLGAYGRFNTGIEVVHQKRDGGVHWDFISAGHHAAPTLLVRADGEIEQPHLTGMLLGLVPGSEYDVGFTAHAREGDVVAMYSDCLTESRNADGEQFGPDRVSQIVHDNRHLSAEEIKDALVAGLEAFTGRRIAGNDDGTGLDDDLSIIILKQAEMP